MEDPFSKEQPSRGPEPAEAGVGGRTVFLAATVVLGLVALLLVGRTGGKSGVK